MTVSQHHSQRITRTTAGVVLAAAITAATAGQALAAPPGAAPPSGDTAPGSAPATPVPTPEPAPIAPGPSVIPAPTYDAPIVYESSPGYQAPEYSGSYDPIPRALRSPRPVAPVSPVLPNRLRHPGVIKLGNLRFAQGVISDADARNINGQSATIEARTATYYESIGFPKDQAARAAASTTVGILAGGVAGAIPAALLGGVGGGLIGAGVGAAAGAVTGLVISQAAGGVLAGPGALIGAGVGAGVGGAAGAAGVGALGALGGAALGGVIGYAVGAGDPGGNPNAPLGGATNEDPKLSKPAPPNPAGNQYELHLDRSNLPGNGKVDYVVHKSGDVSGQVNVGPIAAPIAISHQQADAPFQAAGALAQTARDSVARGVAGVSAAAEKAIPGLHISYPQTVPASAVKHRK